jgi:hypothetical protein
MVIDSNNCSGKTDTVIVTGGDIIPKVYLSAPTRFCDGDSLTLTVEDGFIQHFWSNHSDARSITIGTSGSYSVMAVDSFGCVWTSDLVDVVVDTNPLYIINLPDKTLWMDSTMADEIVCDSIIIRNLSTLPIQIEKTQLFRNIEFSVPQAQIVMDIPGLAERGLRVCYRPSELQEQRDTLIIGDYCKRTVYLRSAGVANRYRSISRCNVPFKAITTEIHTLGLNVSVAFPNPARDQFSMILQSKYDFEITSAILVDAMGRSVASGLVRSVIIPFSLHSKEVAFSVADVADGLYHAHFIIQGEVYSATVVVSK